MQRPYITHRESDQGFTAEPATRGLGRFGAGVRDNSSSRPDFDQKFGRPVTQYALRSEPTSYMFLSVAVRAVSGVSGVFKPSALLFAGAVLATAGAAHAQDQTGAAAAVSAQAAVPWYQRFTTSNGVTESITGEVENDRIEAPAWNLNQRWGIIVDVREAQRIERLPDGGRGDQTSVGAYYQFTPRVRVGGQLSVESNSGLSSAPSLNDTEEARAGVRIESAFRF